MAAVGLVVAAPIILAAAIGVRLTSSGPAFYSQKRLGRHGRTFRIRKLRTMRHNCEADSGPQWSAPGDPRVTPFGRFLRTSHIDELPQLWNVLVGDMAFVGPRPERPEIAKDLELCIADYHDRVQVLPGLTGVAQVLQPADVDLESVRTKVELDRIYIRHRSFLLDFQCVIATALYVFRMPRRTAGELCGLDQVVKADKAAREAKIAFTDTVLE